MLKVRDTQPHYQNISRQNPSLDRNFNIVNFLTRFISQDKTRYNDNISPENYIFDKFMLDSCINGAFCNNSVSYLTSPGYLATPCYVGLCFHHHGVPSGHRNIPTLNPNILGSFWYTVKWPPLSLSHLTAMASVLLGPPGLTSPSQPGKEIFSHEELGQPC